MIFFPEGASEISNQAAQTARELLALFDMDHAKLARLGQRGVLAIRRHQILQQRPFMTTRKASDALGVSRPTAAKALKTLERLEIVRKVEATGRTRMPVHSDYMAVLSRETDPL